MQHSRITIDDGEETLIDFDNCKALMRRIDQILEYQRISYSFNQDSVMDNVEYVERNLAHISLHQSVEDALRHRSEELRRLEDRAFDERVMELEAAGFRTADGA